jgi:hypothetical protein
MATISTHHPIRLMMSEPLLMLVGIWHQPSSLHSALTQQLIGHTLPPERLEGWEE